MAKKTASKAKVERRPGEKSYHVPLGKVIMWLERGERLRDELAASPSERDRNLAAGIDMFISKNRPDVDEMYELWQEEQAERKAKKAKESKR